MDTLVRRNLPIKFQFSTINFNFRILKWDIAYFTQNDRVLKWDKLISNDRLHCLFNNTVLK